MRHYIKFLLLFIFPLMMLSCTIGYNKHDGKVYYDTWNEGSGHTSRLLKEADAESFEELKDGYARDKNYAWLDGELLKGAKGKSFKVLTEGYATDGVHVYFDHYQQGKTVTMNVRDIASFKVHTYYLAEDKYDYYWEGEALNVADKSSFVLCNEKKDGDASWGKDKQYVYFLGSGRIKIADYASFKPVEKSGLDIGSDIMPSGAYASDKYQVYYYDYDIDTDKGQLLIVHGADPGTFREVDHEKGQDKYRVYVGAKPTDVKDYKSLKKGDWFYTTARYVYDDDLSLIKAADPKTFECIYGVWYRDKNHIYTDGKLVEEADVKTFTTKVVWDSYDCTYDDDFNYAKDAHHVYFGDSILVGADPATFTKLDAGETGWTVFDRNHFYEGEENEVTRAFKRQHFR